MAALIVSLIVALVLILVGFMLAARVIKQYEAGVLFRLGRVRGTREPGSHLIIPFIDVLHRVSMRIVTMRSSRRASSRATT